MSKPETSSPSALAPDADISCGSRKVSTRNACRLCAPLGACLVFKGIQGAMPFLHGSQGCAIYIRRYLISHFREPMDIAATNFSEETAVFGGGQVLQTGFRNLLAQYNPEMVGLATTCLSETIGEDVPALVSAARESLPTLPPVVHVATPSYQGSHVKGFNDTVTAVVQQLAQPTPAHHRVGLLPGMLSAADLRYLRELTTAFGLDPIMLPDYSQTLDGASWSQYEKIPQGGTSLDDIARLPGAPVVLELGACLAQDPNTAAGYLLSRFGVLRCSLPLPIGLRHSDALVAALQRASGRELPASWRAERGRLIDAMVDGHKLVFGKRAAVFGDPDVVIGLTSFLTEIGVVPALVASGSHVEDFPSILRTAVPDLPPESKILNGADFGEIADQAPGLELDVLIGNSKGYTLSRDLDIPLLRVGFPIHDRIGAQRILHVGHRGALGLFDSLYNLFLDRKQTRSPVGYTYL